MVCVWVTGQTGIKNICILIFLNPCLSGHPHPYPSTVKTEIVENLANFRTLELPLLVRSVAQVRAEGGSSRRVFSPNPKSEILGILLPFSIISVLTVLPSDDVRTLQFINYPDIEKTT